MTNDAPLSNFPPEKPETPPTALHQQPAVWVETLAVYRDWPPSGETRLRRMDLHRGLNILWARPAQSEDPAARIAGHGAGKTTFCRLLRYVLDEARPGTLQFRKDFDAKFDHRTGWVLGVVWLNGQRWLVGRPINVTGGYGSFARQEGRIEDQWQASPPATGYADYTNALEDAVFQRLKLRLLSGSGRKLEWDGASQWLSRDQEAHYGGLLEWRHTDSESGSPELMHADKENLVRLMLGLVSPDEQKLLRKHAEQAAEHKKGIESKPKLEHVVQRQRERLERLLGHEVPDPKLPLLQIEVQTKVNDLRRRSDAALIAAQEDAELDGLLMSLSTAEADWKLAQALVADSELRIAVAEGRTEVAQEKAKAMATLESFRDLLPFRGFCSHRLDEAWRERCPFADRRKSDEEIDQTVQQVKTDAEREAAELGQQKALLARQQEWAGETTRKFQAARTAVEKLRKRRKRKLQRLSGPRQKASDLETAFNDYRDACAELEELKTALEGIEKIKTALDRDLEVMAKQHREPIELFGRLFNRIVQTLLGPAVKGSVEFSGKSIEPQLTYHGRRDSAALKLTKLLAFDLAALALGVCSKDAHHPRFLIHDSPREADLAAVIYRALFTAARELEKQFGGQDAPFQYIITTTEAPLDEVNRAPWLLDPVLDASDPKMRFLGVDLG